MGKKRRQVTQKVCIVADTPLQPVVTQTVSTRADEFEEEERDVLTKKKRVSKLWKTTLQMSGKKFKLHNGRRRKKNTKTKNGHMKIIHPHKTHSSGTLAKAGTTFGDPCLPSEENTGKGILPSWGTKLC